MDRQQNRLYPTFRYRDPEKALDWLTGTVGFAQHSRFDSGGRLAHAELALGGAMIMIGGIADDAFGALVGGPGEQGGKALYVVVADPDALFGRVEASGVAIEEGLTDRPYGSREFVCRDTEGNVWCFGTYHPAAGDG